MEYLANQYQKIERCTNLNISTPAGNMVLTALAGAAQMEKELFLKRIHSEK